MDPKSPDNKTPWAAPRLATLHVSLTQAGPSPNVQETALTDASLAPDSPV
jgi:hypothetical protein